MEFHINKSELLVLTHLHENYKGVGEEFFFEAEQVGVALDILADDLLKASSYLRSHGLVGMVLEVGRNSQNRGQLFFHAIWLTGLGEDYIRALEAEPGVAQKLTVSALTGLWDAGTNILKAAAGSLLGEYAKHATGLTK